MYHAKSKGRANCRFFEPAMAEAAMAELAMESRLAHALREHEFVLHYQPQFALRDGALVGCEALIRWAPPGRPLVQPDAFIPLAESRRLMLPRAIIQMAKSLGLRTVAEGVETEAQHAWVQAQGCDKMQGEFAASPMAGGDFEAWLP